MQSKVFKKHLKIKVRGLHSNLFLILYETILKNISLVSPWTL